MPRHTVSRVYVRCFAFAIIFAVVPAQASWKHSASDNAPEQGPATGGEDVRLSALMAVVFHSPGSR